LEEIKGISDKNLQDLVDINMVEEEDGDSFNKLY
jgi:hypothetical protein